MPDPKLLKALESIGFKAYYYRYDGPCNMMFHSYREPPYKELCFCGDYINTCFYEEYFPIARKKELPYRGYSPEHKLIRVFPIPDDARDAARRFVRGTRTEVQKGWWMRRGRNSCECTTRRSST